MDENEALAAVRRIKEDAEALGIRIAAGQYVVAREIQSNMGDSMLEIDNFLKERGT